MLPYRISKQVDSFSRLDNDYAFVFSDMNLINQNGEKINDSYFELIWETSQSISEILTYQKNKKLSYCINKNIFPAPSILFKINILLKVGGWDESLYFEDWDMNLRLINQVYKFGLNKEILVSYRKNVNSITLNPNQKYLESCLILFYKYKKINKEIDIEVNKIINEYATKLYESGSNKSSIWLFRKLLKDFRFSTLFLLLMSLIGVSAKEAYSIINFFKLRY